MTAPSVLVAHPGAELYGSDRVLLESVAGLLESGGRVVVALPDRGPLADRLERIGAQVRICRMPVVRKSVLRPSGAARFARDAVVGWRAARGLIRDVGPDALLVNTLTIPLWTAAARSLRVPVLVHVHEAERSAPSVLRTAIAAPLLLATRVIANSGYSVRVLAGSFRRLAGTPIVDNGVPGPEVIVPPRDRIDDGLNVVYVGRLSPRKGVDTAIDAIAGLRRAGVAARLSIVGSVFEGYEWYETQLNDQVVRLGIEDAVRFCGFRSNVWGEIAAADVLVVPSRADEPFGNTAVEGVLAARCVIASATSGLLEATRGYSSTATVPPDDPDALAAALARVVEQWEEVRSAAIRDARTAAARHAPELYRRRIRESVAATIAAARHGSRTEPAPLAWTSRRELATDDADR